ncbi:Spc98 family-domain-containing protein [Fimicolochytrium jonesii]|uniref:Spc98 family-domain-containing protein n=1 Tax=Fimicolochytrium jonesii TaxID=1396493 RepID=UPI0022FE0CB9|nr:Spc98 family-domain-containing protein [Fimicolochytrium jonesii]KAI8817416.1 Spc98 family-domain-containing protein [Fimicolochytrium jonesii]
MSSWRRFSAAGQRSIQKADQLVKLVTGLEPDNEYFQVYVSFVQKNLAEHNFQTTNEHEVAHRYRGLLEKFSMHGQLRAMETLSRHIDSLFRQQPKELLLINDVLRLLLELSDTPTHHEYTPTLSSIEKETSISWEDIIAEEPLVGSHWKAEEEVEIDTDSESADADTTKVVESWNSELLDEEGHWAHDWRNFQAEERRVAFRQREYRLLNDLQYWNQPPKASIYKQYDPDDPCSLVPALETHRIDETESIFQPWKVAEERDLVRECLFMMGGASTPVFTVLEDGTVQVDNELRLLHATERSLRDILEWFAECGSAVNRVRNYIARVSSGVGARNLTEEAFANALSSLLLELDQDIAELEMMFQPYMRAMQKAGEQEVCTLMELQTRLSLKTDIFRDFSSIIGGVRAEDVASSADLTNTLLSTLHTRAAYYEFACQPHKLAVIMQVLARTVEPYLRMIHSWIQQGVLDDPFDEFLLVRQSPDDIQTDDWYHTYSIRTHPSADTNKAGPAVPTFLVTSCRDVLTCGKSLAMIERLDAKQALRCKSAYGRPLQDEIAELLDPGRAVAPEIGSGDRGRDVGEVPRAMSALLGLDTPDHVQPDENRDISEAPPTPPATLHPTTHTLPTALAQRITAQKLAVGNHLTRLLLDKCGLREHLRALQAVCLMTAGPVMHAFSGRVFRNMQAKKLPAKPELLNSIFAESLADYAADYPFVDRRLVHFALAGATTTRYGGDVAEVLNRVTISYDVPHPLRPIIPPSTLSTYTTITRALLQIKHAMTQLEENGRDWSRGRGGRGAAKRDVELERIRLGLKLRLRHFVGSLWAFFMGGIIHAECAKLDSQLGTAQGMDELITLHEKFVTGGRDKCLLGSKTAVLWNLISSLLQLCTEFAGLCRAMDERALPSDDNDHYEPSMQDVTVDFEHDLRRIWDKSEREIASLGKTLEAVASHGVEHLRSLAAALA